jgi:uncharacterized protein YggE
MKLRLGTAALTALASLAVALYAHPAVAAEEPATIVVVGHGAASREPDRAVVAVAITTIDDVASTATGKNNTIYAKLRSALTALGIPDSGVRTTYYNISYAPRPDKRDGPPQPAQVYGYTVNRTLTVTWAQTQNVGKIVDAAVTSGGTIDSVGFDVGDRRGAYADALKAAVEDAGAQAQALAGAARVHVTGIRAIQSDGEMPVRAPMMRMNALAAPAPATEISGSPIDITATVTITYTIAQ